MAPLLKLAVCSLTLILAGCGTTITGRVSAPLPQENWSKKDYTWELRTDQFLVSVGAANFRQDGQPLIDSGLTIWIRINAIVEEVSFDPFRVTLSSDGTEEVGAAVVRGPFPIPFEARARLPREIECAGAGVYSLAGHGLPGKVLEEGEALTIEGKRCFGLDFDVDSDPSRTFTLRIDGLRVGDVQVPAKEVQFVEAKYEIYFDGYHGTPDYIFVRPAAGG